METKIRLIIKTGVTHPPHILPAVRRLKQLIEREFSTQQMYTWLSPDVTAIHTEVDITVIGEPAHRPAGVTAICIVHATAPRPVTLSKMRAREALTGERWPDLRLVKAAV